MINISIDVLVTSNIFISLSFPSFVMFPNSFLGWILLLLNQWISVIILASSGVGLMVKLWYGQIVQPRWYCLSWTITIQKRWIKNSLIDLSEFNYTRSISWIVFWYRIWVNNEMIFNSLLNLRCIVSLNGIRVLHVQSLLICLYIY